MHLFYLITSPIIKKRELGYSTYIEARNFECPLQDISSFPRVFHEWLRALFSFKRLIVVSVYFLYFPIML